MHTFRKRFMIGVTAVGIGFGACVAQAQTPAQPPAAATAPAGHGSHHDGKFKERMAQRAAELHAKLKLSASQEPAWQTFIAAMKPNGQHEHMGQRPDRAEWAKLSAPERMEKMLGKMKERQAQMETRLDAMKTFYAVLTPEQQKIFNDNVGKGFGHGHGHDRDHGGKHDQAPAR